MPSATIQRLVTDAEAREEEHSDRHDRRSDDREDPVPPPAADQLTAEHRGHEQTQHQGCQLESGPGCAHAFDDLQVERQVRHRTEQREADDEAHRTRDCEGAVSEEGKGQDRLRDARLNEKRTPLAQRRRS